MSMGVNVAIPFHGHVPPTYLGDPVIDGAHPGLTTAADRW